MKEEQLKESESKKIILATYSMASEGLDIKTLTTLLLASPKTDIVQAIGRILRTKHTNPLVIDIVDSHDIFQRQFSECFLNIGFSCWFWNIQYTIRFYRHKYIIY